MSLRHLMAMTYHDLGAGLAFVFRRLLQESPCRRFTSLLYSFVNKKLVKLVAVSVEHVDVHFTGYSANPSVGAQLPEHQSHFGLIFAVARYPHHVVAHEVGRFGQILVHKLLADIQYGLHSRALSYDV